MNNECIRIYYNQFKNINNFDLGYPKNKYESLILFLVWFNFAGYSLVLFVSTLAQ